MRHHVRSVSTRVADSGKAKLAACTLFVYGLLTLVIVLNAESKMFSHSVFERRRCCFKFASLCLASAPHCHVGAERIVFLVSPACICIQSADRLQGNYDRLQRCSVDLNVQRACSLQRNKQVLEIIGK